MIEFNKIIKKQGGIMSFGFATSTSMIGGLYKFTNQELKDKIINNYFDFYHINAYIIIMRIHTIKFYLYKIYYRG